MAIALKRSFPITWIHLINDSSRKLKFYSNFSSELEVADKIVGAMAGPVYVDYSALMTLTLLDDVTRTKLMKAVGSARIMQSLIDDLQDQSVYASLHSSKEGMRVSIGDDGRLIRAPLGDEQSFLVRVLGVARDVAIPLPAYSRFSTRPDELEVVSRVLGTPTSDMLWEASASGGVLLCDDQALKSLALSQYRVPSTSIQAIALAARRQNKLTLKEYSAVVEKLAVARYEFVAVDRDTIESSLREHGWKLTPETSALLECLDGPGPADSISGALLIGAGLLRIIILEKMLESSQAALVTALLERLVKGRDVNLVVHVLRRVLDQLLVLVPVHRARLETTIDAWLSTRS